MNRRFTRFLIFASLFFPLFCFSQGEFNNWYFGVKAGMSFNLGSPVPFLSSEMSSPIGGSSNVSDSLGNILFYSSGFEVYNKNNYVMPNGWITGTHGAYTYLKDNIAFQQLNDLTKYYLFTGGGGIYNGGLQYSVIDMTLDGGLGDVVPGLNGVYIPGASLSFGTVTATRHHNNHDVWVVARLYDTDSNYYISYLVNSSGINFTPVLSNSHIQLYPTGGPSTMCFKISRDGTKMAAVYDTILEYCNFNSATGQITPLFLVPLLPVCGGHFIRPDNVEFSIDSKYLYVTGEGSTICPQPRDYLYQFDATIIDSAQFLNNAIMISNEYHSHGLQLAPDGKIYCSILANNDSMSVINNPSVHGTGCNYQANVLSLLGRQSGYSLPDYVERYYAMIYDSGQCQDSSVNFSSAIWPPADSIHWDFGDPPSGPDNYSSLPNPSHVYPPVSGTYTVELFVRHIDKRTDTTWKVINILQKPDIGPDQTTCTGDSVTFDAGSCPGCIYVWKELDNGLTVGTTQTFRTDQAGTYAAIVTYSNGCIGSDTVQLFTTPVPSVTNNPLSKSICSGESTNIPLTANIPGTTFHWTATLTSGNITGFSPDSGLIINQILVNSLATTGIVTYHITPKVGSCAGNTVDFPVTVNPGDSVKVSISASDNNTCSGTPVTYTATPTNGGVPTYQWKVNGLTAGSNSPNYTYSPINGDNVSCILISSLTVCISNNPATSNSIQMIVNPLNPVSVTISPSANPVCAGTNVIYTATPIHGGTNPVYQWKVNGVIVGTNNPIYSYTPVNGDIVTCVLTSNILCPTGNPATSNTITMTVNPNLLVSVSISASANHFCLGSQVTYTAIPTNGGGTPTYQWKVNGIGVGPDNPVYSYSPNNGDVVSCILTSNITCPVGNPATSNSITMIVNANLPAGISITASANPFCPGNSVTFTAAIMNGGPTPSYQWKVNGANAGANSPTYSYNPASGDLVSCILTSNLACVTGNPATSNTIIMNGTLAPIVSLTLCNDTITTTNAKPFKLKGGIPLGGTYSGVGVAGGIFNPVIAGVGSHQITYTYTNAALCSANAHSFLHIFNPSNLPCGSPLTDIRDNKVYPTVQIGSQCWMAANLNYGTMISGNISQRDNCIWEKYCYNDVAANCGQQTYYQWDELMQYNETVSTQGFCPPGWHIPTEADWNTLFALYINNGFAGSPLKYSGFSGFNAILFGASHLNKNWDYQGFATFFWSSTAHGALKAWSHGMNEPDPSVSAYPAFKSNAFSVRCLKD